MFFLFPSNNFFFLAQTVCRRRLSRHLHDSSKSKGCLAWRGCLDEDKTKVTLQINTIRSARPPRRLVASSPVADDLRDRSCFSHLLITHSNLPPCIKLYVCMSYCMHVCIYIEGASARTGSKSCLCLAALGLPSVRQSRAEHTQTDWPFATHRPVLSCQKGLPPGIRTRDGDGGRASRKGATAHLPVPAIVWGNIRSVWGPRRSPPPLPQAALAKRIKR